MTKTLILALIVNSLVLGKAIAASFDCNRASGFAEKTVCSDKELSGLDDVLNSSYQKAIEEADQPAQVKNDQKAWLTEKRPACKTTACLKQAYQQRIKSLATVKRFYWKTYADQYNGIAFVYPSNRTIQSEENAIKVLGFSMPDGHDYIIKFQLGNGDFARAIEETGTFEKTKEGEWIAGIGRFKNPPAEKISGTGWSGIKTNIACGISDEETGFHAAAGECIWAILSDGKRYIEADTLGILGLDDDTMKTLLSIKFLD